MKKIICVMGKSGSGKDTVAKALYFNSYIKKITPCTTRPMRAEESELNPYHFIIDEDVNKVMIAKTQYIRADGAYYYGFVNEELDDRYNYLAVINPAQLCGISKRYRDKFEIIVVQIKTDEEHRIIHVIEREDKNDRDYKEVCRRIKTDAYDFSDNNSDYSDIQDLADEVLVIYNDYKMTPDDIALELLDKLKLEDEE